VHISSYECLQVMRGAFYHALISFFSLITTLFV